MDVQTVVIAACSDIVQLYHSIPADRPEEFGVVERTGGDLTNYVIDRALVSVQLFAATRGRLRELVGQMQQAIEQLKFSEPNVFGSDVLSVFEDNDLQSHELATTINCQIIYNF